MPHPTEPVIVRHPDVPGLMVALDPAIDYDPADPLVKAYPWAFVPRDTTAGIIEAVQIEQATAGPGEKRRPGRPRKTPE
jgi:hypothetical protein